MNTNKTIDGELREKVIATLKDIKRQIIEDSGRETYFATMMAVKTLGEICQLLREIEAGGIDHDQGV